MAHMIDMENNRANIAFTGSRANVWHGLGQEMTQDASLEDWIVEAGLAWEVFESEISYQSAQGSHVFPDKRALFRSDTQSALGIVSKDYKVVQPVEVMEFFRDLTTIHGMKLSSAGSLYGGKRFWALAETGNTTQAIKGDVTDGYLLLVTSVDSTIATIAKMTSTRVVCQNTLSASMKGSSKNMVRKTHAAVWDPESVKIEMGLVDESWDSFSKSLKRLAEVEVTDKFVREYLQSKFYVKCVPVEDQGRGAIKQVSELIELYNSGAGANYSRGTAYGILQACTDRFTHGTGRRDPNHQMWDCYFGKQDNIKSEVFNELTEMFA